MPFQSEAEAAGYLAGMIDGEGTVTIPGGNHRLRRVSIANTDHALLLACGEACDRLGIEWSIYARKRPERWSPAWDLVIYGQPNILRVADLPLRSAAKYWKLQTLVASWEYARRARKRWPIQELRRLYEDERLSVEGLAVHFKVSPGTIHRWMVAGGIPRRTNSEGVRLAWAEGRRVAVR